VRRTERSMNEGMKAPSAGSPPGAILAAYMIGSSMKDPGAAIPLAAKEDFQDRRAEKIFG